MEFEKIEYCIIHLSSGESFPVEDTSGNVLGDREKEFKTFKVLSPNVIGDRMVTVKTNEIVAIEDVSQER